MPAAHRRMHSTFRSKRRLRRPAARSTYTSAATHARQRRALGRRRIQQRTSGTVATHTLLVGRKHHAGRRHQQPAAACARRLAARAVRAALQLARACRH
eukprot:1846636-Prymnesium_polylepis.1